VSIKQTKLNQNNYKLLADVTVSEQSLLAKHFFSFFGRLVEFGSKRRLSTVVFFFLACCFFVTACEGFVVFELLL